MISYGNLSRWYIDTCLGLPGTFMHLATHELLVERKAPILGDGRKCIQIQVSASRSAKMRRQNGWGRKMKPGVYRAARYKRYRPRQGGGKNICHLGGKWF